jgi:hypothetical protein
MSNIVLNKVLGELILTVDDIIVQNKVVVNFVGNASNEIADDLVM